LQTFDWDCGTDIGYEEFTSLVHGDRPIEKTGNMGGDGVSTNTIEHVLAVRWNQRKSQEHEGILAVAQHRARDRE
jgi:hypothetical protein